MSNGIKVVVFLEDDVANDQIPQPPIGLTDGTDDGYLEPEPRGAEGQDVDLQPIAEAQPIDLDIVVEAPGAIQTAPSEEQAGGSASAEAIELQEFNTSGMPGGSDANRLEVGPLISECKLILTLEFKRK